MFLLHYPFWKATWRMYQFLFWRNDIGNHCGKHTVCPGRIDGPFRDCLVDGTWRLYRKCDQVSHEPRTEFRSSLFKKKLQACKPDSVWGYHLSVPAIKIGRASCRE